MKLFLISSLILALACATFGHAVVNKTPKSGWNDVCDECQDIIKRIVAVASDPEKVAELKILLEALCHESSYEAECKLFVSKLDRFLKELLPYLQDAHHVCQELHICSNRRLQQFHRVGMLYARTQPNGAKDLICEECQLAAHELSQEVNDPQFQQEVHDWLEARVCRHFGQYKATCDEFINDMLPLFWQELHDILADQKKFCQDLELCAPTAGGDAFLSAIGRQQPLPHQQQQQKHQSLSEYVQHHFSTHRTEAAPAAVCLECRMLMEAIQQELTRNSTVHRLANELRSVVCPLFSNPGQESGDCEDFLRIYGPSAAFLSALELANPGNVCTRAQFCTPQQYRHIESLVLHSHHSPKQSKHFNTFRCNSCEALSELMEVELCKQDVQAQLIDTLNAYLCERVLTGWRPICASLVRSYIPPALATVVRALQEDKLCKLIYACPKT